MIQQLSLYGDLILWLRDFAARSLTQHAPATSEGEFRDRIDAEIRRWFAAPQEDLLGYAPRDIIWRELRDEKNPIPPDKVADMGVDDCPLCIAMRDDAHEHAESWSWTYCPEDHVMEQFDPEGSEAYWSEQLADPVRPSPPRPFTLAQHSHLQLLRYTKHNLLHGEVVAEELVEMSERWVAALVDNAGLADEAPSSLLIKLRDMDSGVYNVDTLYVLARSREDAEHIGSMKERWRADEVCILPPEDLDNALGGDERGFWLVMLWWD
ncbi:MAG: hypothetical protein AB2A00_07105 [Myxococcota bacterium]